MPLGIVLNSLHLFQQLLGPDGRLVIREEALAYHGAQAHFDRKLEQQFLYWPLPVLRKLLSAYFQVVAEECLDEHASAKGASSTWVWCLRH